WSADWLTRHEHLLPVRRGKRRPHPRGRSVRRRRWQELCVPWWWRFLSDVDDGLEPGVGRCWAAGRCQEVRQLGARDDVLQEEAGHATVSAGARLASRERVVGVDRALRVAREVPPGEVKGC